MLFQVSKGTTNSAQSLLLHRFREAYGRDRRVSSGQVTRFLISILFLYFYRFLYSTTVYYIILSIKEKKWGREEIETRNGTKGGETRVSSRSSVENDKSFVPLQAAWIQEGDAGYGENVEPNDRDLSDRRRRTAEDVLRQPRR